MDWSSTNFIALGLSRELYLRNASSTETTLLFGEDERAAIYGTNIPYVSSTAWIQNKSNILAVGLSNSVVEIWDTTRRACVRQLRCSDGVKPKTLP